MARTSYKLTGFAELDAKLAELPNNIGRAAARRGMKKAGAIVEDAQRNLAPHDDGDLIASIGSEVKSKNRTGLNQYHLALKGGGTTADAVSALRTARREAKAAGTSEGTRITVRIGPTAPHSKLVEFGTKPRTQKSTGRFTGVMPAIPFVRPSLDNNQVAVLAAIKNEITVEIRKSTARIERRAARLAAAGV